MYLSKWNFAEYVHLTSLAIRGDVTDYTPPVVMGHELAGIVAESRHSDVKVGEHVTVKSNALMWNMRKLPK